MKPKARKHLETITDFQESEKWSKITKVVDKSQPKKFFAKTLRRKVSLLCLCFFQSFFSRIVKLFGESNVLI